MRFVQEGLVQPSLFEPQLLGPIRALLRWTIDKAPARRPEHAGIVAAELKRIARLLGIPDVPAFIAKSIDEAFPDDDAIEAEVVEISDEDIIEIPFEGPAAPRTEYDVET